MLDVQKGLQNQYRETLCGLHPASPDAAALHNQSGDQN